MPKSTVLQIFDILSLSDADYIVTGWPSIFFVASSREKLFILPKAGFIVGLAIFPSTGENFAHEVSLWFQCFSSKLSATSVYKDFSNKISSGVFGNSNVYIQIQKHLEDKRKQEKTWCFAKFTLEDGFK